MHGSDASGFSLSECTHPTTEVKRYERALKRYERAWHAYCTSHGLIKPRPVLRPASLCKSASDHAGQVGWLGALCPPGDGRAPLADLGWATTCARLQHLFASAYNTNGYVASSVPLLIKQIGGCNATEYCVQVIVVLHMLIECTAMILLSL